MGVLNGYDNIKSQAMNTHNEIEGNVNNIKNSLAKKNIILTSHKIKSNVIIYIKW